MDLNTAIIIICWSAICLFALNANSDLFSPTKFYLLFLSIFHLDILFKDYPVEHEAVVIVYLLIGLVLILQENSGRRDQEPHNFSSKSTQPPTAIGLRIATVLVWALTIPALISQIYLVESLGGIVQYVDSLEGRANGWRGKGPLLIIIKSIMVIQIIYFTIGVVWRVKNSGWWLIFIAHLAVTLSIAFLTGSRTVVLLNFVVMLVFSHYFVQRQTIIKLACIAAFILITAAALAVTRQNVKLETDSYSILPRFIIQKHYYEDGDDSVAKSDATKMFKYGLIPLDFIFSSEPQNLQYGLSILTPITNIVPRKLWPKKFDTASMAMNKEYIEDRGAGPYQYPTGIIGFGVMNFGWSIGIPFAFSLLWFLMTMVVSVYSRTFTEQIKPSLENGLIVVALIYSSFSVTNLIIGEFANNLINFGLTQLLPILAFIMVYTTMIRLFDPDHKKNNSRSKLSE